MYSAYYPPTQAARATERFGFRAVVLAGLALSGVMAVLTPLATGFVMLVALQVVAGLGRGLLGVALMSLAILSVDQRERATAMGVYQAVYAIGMFLGPLVGGVIGEHAGLGAVFVTTAIVSLGTAVMARFKLRARY